MRVFQADRHKDQTRTCATKTRLVPNTMRLLQVDNKVWKSCEGDSKDAEVVSAICVLNVDLLKSNR